MHPLTEAQADYIRQLYRTPPGQMIQVKPWNRINEDAVAICRLSYPHLRWEGTVIDKIIVTLKDVTIKYTCLPYTLAPEEERRRSNIRMRLDNPGDHVLWQALLFHKYAVTILIDPATRMFGNVLELGIGEEQL